MNHHAQIHLVRHDGAARHDSAGRHLHQRDDQAGSAANAGARCTGSRMWRAIGGRDPLLYAGEGRRAPAVAFAAVLAVLLGGGWSSIGDNASLRYQHFCNPNRNRSVKAQIIRD